MKSESGHISKEVVDFVEECKSFGKWPWSEIKVIESNKSNVSGRGLSRR